MDLGVQEHLSKDTDTKGVAQTFKRRQTELPGGRSHLALRFEAMSVPPESLSKMHRMHTIMMQGDKLHEDTSEAAMDQMWARNSWHMFPKPPVSHERAWAVRGWQVRPQGVSALGLMKTFGVAAINSKGCKGWGDKSVGQDSCSMSVLPSGWNVFSLFDGHGENGHWPSLRASRTFPYLLEASQSCAAMLKRGDVEAALHHAYEKVQHDLVQQSNTENVSLEFCGSTAVCVLQHPEHDRIWVANCGDSKAIMIVPGQGVVAETTDHKPSLERERQRVEASGMELHTTVHDDDGFVEERLCVAGEDYPGLSMTRSLGDLSVKNHGVVAEPEVSTWTWNTDGCTTSYIVIASDGLWDFLSPQEVSSMVLDLISAGESLQVATEKLLQAAQEKWKEFDDFYCDDITVLLLPGKAHDRPKEAWNQARQDEGCCSAGLKLFQCTVQ